MIFKHQETFAAELATSWQNGNREHVRLTMRGLKNVAQASYVAAMVAMILNETNEGSLFCSFIHPNN